MLGRQMVREVVYRVLCGEQGGALRALASRDDHFTRIVRVLKQVHAEYAKPLSAEDMARRAGMSVSAFNHHFKLVTASSPLQYLKRIRLDNAKRLMSHDGYNASTAARAVGYESPSQFSREFKRLFGVTPVEEAEQMRSRLTASLYVLYGSSGNALPCPGPGLQPVDEDLDGRLIDEDPELDRMTGRDMRSRESPGESGRTRRSRIGDDPGRRSTCGCRSPRPSGSSLPRRG